MASSPSDVTSATESVSLRYRPDSAIDAFRDWIEERHIPWWLVFAIVFLLVGGSINGVRWAEGTNEFPVLDRYSADGFYPAFALAAYGLLTRAAGRAMSRFEPSLDESAESIARSRRRLTRIPLWQSLVAFAVGATFGIVSLVTEPSYLAAVSSTAAMSIVTVLFGFILGYGTGIVVLWQLVRIVAEVMALHRRAAVVSLDRPGPSHAFAPVTAGGGVFLVGLISFSALTDPATFANPALVGFMFTVSVAAALVFVLPLLGMRRRIIEAKRDRIDALGIRIEAAVEDLAVALDAERYADAEPIGTAIETLTEQIGRTKRASTWPWDARVASGFATTVLIPLAIWFVTTYAGRLLGI